MDRFIARQNIEHFRQLLEKETDPAKREAIALLLGQEEEKLRLALAAMPKPKPKRDEPAA